MSRTELDEQEEKPLDPEVEKVRRKMVRLLAVSIGIMFVGVMAVLAAIVYQVTQPEEEPELAAGARPVLQAAEGAPLEAQAALPEGFVVEEVALDGGNVLFFGRTAEGAARAFILDVAAGHIVADIAIGE